MDGRGSGQDGLPAVPPVVLQHRSSAVNSEGPDRVVLPIDDVEDQGFRVKELTVPPQVDVTPAVPVGEAARRNESLNSLHSGVEPGGVVEAVGEEDEGLACVFGAEIAVPDRGDRLEVDPAGG